MFGEVEMRSVDTVSALQDGGSAGNEKKLILENFFR